MSYTYTVQKRKSNRSAYRILGIVFIIVAALQLVTLIMGYGKYLMLTALFVVLLGSYGVYLTIMSFRKQAYDITYRFDDSGMKVTHRYGETMYTFDDIDFITMVIADEHQIFYMLNVKAGKDIYTIPFTMKKELAETIYEFVNSRIKHEDEEESNQIEN
ncbi:MAG: hypothetical protein ACI4D8_04940 [Wujia sp.]